MHLETLNIPHCESRTLITLSWRTNPIRLAMISTSVAIQVKPFSPRRPDPVFITIGWNSLLAKVQRPFCSQFATCRSDYFRAPTAQISLPGFLRLWLQLLRSNTSAGLRCLDWLVQWDWIGIPFSTDPMGPHSAPRGLNSTFVQSIQPLFSPYSAPQVLNSDSFCSGPIQLIQPSFSPRWTSAGPFFSSLVPASIL